MKTTLLILACPLLMACAGERQQQAQTETHYPSEVTTDKNGVIEMDKYYYSDTLTWQGRACEYIIEREPVEPASTVTDDDGNCYRDNLLRLTVKCGDLLCAREWVKDKLSDYIDPQYLRKSVIAGMAFYNADDNGLCFALSVGLPDSDESVQLRVVLSRQGTFTITNDDFLEDPLENYSGN